VLRQRHEAPVLLPGLVVDLHEALDLPLEVLAAHVADGDPVFGLELRRQLLEHRKQLALARRHVEAPLVEVHRLREPCALEQALVVGLVP
jgi:hypothetical protein